VPPHSLERTTMVDFSNYESIREDGTTPRPFVFNDVKGAPGLLALPATSANKKYHNASMNALGKRTNQGRKKQRINVQNIDWALREDAKMLAHYCVTGWSNAPIDNDGNAVPFTAENCLAFFLVMPDWMFNEFRNWVSEPTNFMNEDMDGDAEADEPGESQTSTQPESAGNADIIETPSQ